MDAVQYIVFLLFEDIMGKVDIYTFINCSGYSLHFNGEGSHPGNIWIPDLSEIIFLQRNVFA
jgi:hypothetical protein